MTDQSTVQQPGAALHAVPVRRLLPALAMLAFCAVPAFAGNTDRDAADEHLRAAELALQRHEYKRAAVEYRRAAELSGSAETARQATRVAYTYGFDEDALEAAGRWTELDEGSDEALLYLAQLQLRVGDLQKARGSFRKLLERSKEPADERLLALMPILSQEDAGDAFELMRQLARPHANSAAANYAVGVMALQADDHEEAGRRAKRAMELDKEWIKPRLLYARSLLLAGSTEKAIDYAARIVGDDPDPDPEARLELAIMYMSAGRDDDALSQVNQILLEQPARTDALRLMAIINFRQENLDAARADFQDLLSSGQYTMDALYYLARIADYRSEYERALALYTQVNSGQHAVISQRRASGILARDGEIDEALDHLQRFGEQHPNHAVDMVLAQAQLLASNGEYERSLEIYDRVASYRPDSESVVLGRAEVLLRLGRADAAVAAYREAVERWPESAMALNALGYTLTYHDDDYDEAARLIRKALKKEPGSAAIIDSHGWVLFRLGKHEEALAELERAWAMIRDPEIGAHIVEVLWELGRCDEARAMMKEAEELDPDHPTLQDVRERVLGETC
ncbi:MAG: tetratricopeptide repeat protein [Woeseiaceae bacterium]|nr:tetratricopeptide repeat protein [Woeseiaceae bacterium]